MRMRARENNKVIRGAFQIGARKGRGSRKTPRRFKMWATTRATLPEMGRRGGRGNAESSYHFTNHCTRSFRIERILIFANLAERQGEVKSRGYAITTSRRLRRVQLLPLHRSACTPPRRKNGNELPRNSQAARLPPPPHLESTAAPEIIKGRPTVKSRSPFASGLNAKTRASCF